MEKKIRGGLCHCINRYAINDNKYIKDYDKIKEFSYLKYWDVNSLYGWAISQKLSGNRDKWVKNGSEFSEDFIKSCNEKVMKDTFFEVVIQYPENYMNLMIYRFRLK